VLHDAPIQFKGLAFRNELGINPRHMPIIIILSGVDGAGTDGSGNDSPRNGREAYDV